MTEEREWRSRDKLDDIRTPLGESNLGSEEPARLNLVCVDCEQLVVFDAANRTDEELRDAKRAHDKECGGRK